MLASANSYPDVSVRLLSCQRQNDSAAVAVLLRMLAFGQAAGGMHEGQVLGHVGNTGNSTEPHLHFHVVDRKSAFDAEGVPYAIRSFDLDASSDQVTSAVSPAGNSLRVDAAALARWRAAPQRRRAEMPLINAIVRVPDR
jgi:diadenosine tetraphosphate (Ap4A) HIT family hydrolase